MSIDPPARAGPRELSQAPNAALSATLWGLSAGVAVALAGRLSSPPVWLLTLITAAVYFGLAWRSRREPFAHTDALALVLELAFLLVLCAAAYQHRMEDAMLPTIGPSELAGLGLIGAGMLLRQRAIAALGSFFTVKLGVTRDQRVVRSGPYRLLRHPNYTGLVLVAFGTALVLASPLAALVAALVWVPAVVLRVCQEESLLVRVFGPEYEAYARSTWRLVPGLF